MGAVVGVSVYTDNYPEETSWSISYEGTTVGSGGPYSIAETTMKLSFVFRLAQKTTYSPSMILMVMVFAAAEVKAITRFMLVPRSLPVAVNLARLNPPFSTLIRIREMVSGRKQPMKAFAKLWRSGLIMRLQQALFMAPSPSGTHRV